MSVLFSTCRICKQRQRPQVRQVAVLYVVGCAARHASGSENFRDVLRGLQTVGLLQALKSIEF